METWRKSEPRRKLFSKTNIYCQNLVRSFVFQNFPKFRFLIGLAVYFKSMLRDFLLRLYGKVPEQVMTSEGGEITFGAGKSLQRWN